VRIIFLQEVHAKTNKHSVGGSSASTNNLEHLPLSRPTFSANNNAAHQAPHSKPARELKRSGGESGGGGSKSAG